MASRLCNNAFTLRSLRPLLAGSNFNDEREKKMEIKNKEGNVIGKIEFQSLENNNVIDNIILDLKPGDGKAIYTANANGNNITQQTNYAAIKWNGNFDELLNGLQPWKPLFPKHTVEEINVYYGFDNLSPSEIDDMANESVQTGRNVIVRDLKPNNTIVGVKIVYRSDMGTYILQIFGTTKSRINISADEHDKITKVVVRGNEGFFISNNDNNQLIWIEEDANGKSLQYEMIGVGSLKDFFSIAESMI